MISPAMISVFELFKIGIGPSSSHTVGPMIAARRWREVLPAGTCAVSVELFGSLAWTGTGHGTDRAVMLGLLGEAPESVDPAHITALLQQLRTDGGFALPDGRRIRFDAAHDLLFNRSELLPLHSNGMRFVARDAGGALLAQQECYSIGGGFIRMADEPAAGAAPSVPWPFASGAQLLRMCGDSGLDIAALQEANERELRTAAQIDAGLDAIADAMFACIARGLDATGVLPGALHVPRRAGALHRQLLAARAAGRLQSHEVMDFISAYAIAVNEENAAGGRVVTAPTNGAAGIVPAVLHYHDRFIAAGTAGDDSSRRELRRRYLLTAGAIGGLIKRNASISGAEVGCQGEVGAAAIRSADWCRCRASSAMPSVPTRPWQPRRWR